MWHRQIRFIDHGAAMYFHHNWESMQSKARSPFAQSEHHVLLPLANAISDAGQKARTLLHEDGLRTILGMVPDEFLGLEEAAGKRDAYLSFFLDRMAYASIFEEEAIRARERQL